MIIGYLLFIYLLICLFIYFISIYRRFMFFYLTNATM